MLKTRSSSDVLDAQRGRFKCRNWANAEIGAGLNSMRVRPAERITKCSSAKRSKDTRSSRNSPRSCAIPKRSDNVNSAALRSAMGDQSGPMYLTRLRTLITPDRMDRDVELVPVDDSHDVSSSHEVASIGRSDDRGDMICTALILGLPLAGCRLLRRKGGCSRKSLPIRIAKSRTCGK